MFDGPGIESAGVVARADSRRPTSGIRLKVFPRGDRSSGAKPSTALIAVGVALIVTPLPGPTPFIGPLAGALSLFAGLFLRLFGV
ncbi:hypothetical protein [Halorubrum sp. SP9]|uniref:hypothetical protein n=1 Tax=Halorubrum sp. SP9 TaxID=1537267 RepID=UPI0010F8DD5F|nr:hypothetical protein [Halorubrum sp. SP9]TKX70619.1 hypothetical protein EXE45_04160 [Halorubrum sp. SP9]